MGTNHLILSELIDLEYRFFQDRDLSLETLQVRDHEIAARLSAQASTQVLKVREWLTIRSQQSDEAPGKRLDASYRLITYLGTFIAGIIGLATASSSLHYDGTTPINLLQSLALMLGIQFFLLITLLIGMIPWVWKFIPLLNPLQEIIRVFAQSRSGVIAKVKPLINDHPTYLFTKRWGYLYVNIERWLIISSTQMAAVVFNLGLLISSLYAIGVSDLAFSWSSTMQIDSLSLHTWFQYLSKPWQTFWPSAVPSLDLVELTRYYKQQSNHDPIIMGTWWKFLIACIVTYGLLPRIILLITAFVCKTRAFGKIELTNYQCRALLERLSRVNYSWHNFPPDQNTQTPTIPHDTVIAPKLPPSGTCIGLLWGDIPLNKIDAQKLVEQAFTWDLIDILPADPESLAQMQGINCKDANYCIFAEAWEAPTKNLNYLLTSLRSIGGRDTPIAILITDNQTQENATSWTYPGPEDIQLWQKRIATFGDPFVRVEPVGSRP